MNQLLPLLTREGMLIKASVSFWRGHKKLKAEDLGLKSQDVSDRLISLGHKRLLPKESLSALSLVESRTHALIEHNTFPFLHGLGHFLPNAKMPEILEQLCELEAQFWSAKEEFLHHYAELRQRAAGEWAAMAGKLVKNPERLVASIEASFPYPQHMDRYYGFNTHLFQIQLPESLEAELLTTAEQQAVIQSRQTAAREAGMKIRREVEQFVGECVASLREQTAQLCDDMLHSIRNSETGVHQKTLNRLIRFIDQFKQMNFADDQVMAGQLEAVRKELLGRTAEEYRDSKYARQKLVSGLTQLSQQARELAQQDATDLVQRFGQMGHRKFHLAA